MKLFSIPIGFILILITPFILWKAESQYRAKDFQTAKKAAVESKVDGYIWTKGKISVEKGLTCPVTQATPDTTCIYINKQVSEYKQKQKEQCGDIASNQTIVKDLEKTQCDSNNENCQKCFLVQEKTWEVIDTKTDYAEFKLGSYKVLFDSAANVIGAKESTQYKQAGTTDSQNPASFPANLPENYRDNAKVGDREIKYNYISSDEEMLVAGNSNDNEINKKDKVFVVSTKSYDQTVSTLESQDSNSKWILRIVALVVSIIGFTMIFSALTAIPEMLTKFIPVLGGQFSKILDKISSFLGCTLGVAFWGIAFVAVMLLKNIIYIGLCAILVTTVTGGVIFITQKKK